jgi:peptidoglycan/xylan/chitin deacetylase (PgdA/CDA1 family)
MDTQKLRGLGKNPLVSYGAHTISHRGLARLPLSEAVDEIQASADYLEKITGTRPSSFAYPYGDGRSVSPRESSILKEAGLSIAVTTRPATLTADHLNALATLPRVSLNGLYQKARYVRALSSGLPFKLTG